MSQLRYQKHFLGFERKPRVWITSFSTERFILGKRQWALRDTKYPSGIALGNVNSSLGKMLRGRSMRAMPAARFLLRPQGLELGVLIKEDPLGSRRVLKVIFCLF